jgi:hypothetical protein
MAFWDPNFVEPNRQYRWYMLFGGGSGSRGTDLSTIGYALKKVDKPKAKVNEITHKYLNHFFYYPGRLEWEPVNVTMASVRKDFENATQILYNILQRAGYAFPGSNILETIDKTSFTAALGDIEIHQIDENGTTIERFTLMNPFFTSVQFGSLDYGSEEIVDITLTIRYDYAKLNNVIPAGRQLGQPV